MIDDRVGVRGLPESLALVAFLPARLFVQALAQARHPRRLLHPVARRRLAAVGAVQAEPPLEFRNPSHKRGDLHRLRLVERDQFFTGRSIWRFSDHPILESESASRVHKNQLKITVPGDNLGSYQKGKVKLKAKAVHKKTTHKTNRKTKKSASARATVAHKSRTPSRHLGVAKPASAAANPVAAKSYAKPVSAAARKGILQRMLGHLGG